MKISIRGYMKYNKYKWVTIQLYLYSLVYRLCVKLIPDKELRRFMGKPGDALDAEISFEQDRYAKGVGFNLDRISRNTPWRTNCLVKSLCVKKLMERKKIPYTLFLGVGLDETGKPIAHSWIKVGSLYVAGGDGRNYACVAKFTNKHL